MEEKSEVHKASHCAWQIHCHVVFPVRNGKTLLDKDVERIIVETAKGISERHDMEFEKMVCAGNHMHLLCSAHSKVAPGQIVRVFKSITAKEIFREKPEVERELREGEFWTDGYYVATVGEGGNWNVVERYVRNEGQSKADLRQMTLF